MRDASGKPLKGLDKQSLESGGRTAQRLTLVWKESKCLRIVGTAAFYGQEEERAVMGAVCTSRVVG